LSVQPLAFWDFQNFIGVWARHRSELQWRLLALVVRQRGFDLKRNAGRNRTKQKMGAADTIGTKWIAILIRIIVITPALTGRGGQLRGQRRQAQMKRKSKGQSTEHTSVCVERRSSFNEFDESARPNE
jgi:hypothetical protein